MNILKILREKKGTTQQDVAFSLGITQQAYANYEAGKREPDNAMLLKLAGYFNTTASYILGEIDNPIPPDAKKGVRISVLGRIPAGIPIEAVEDILDYEEIPAEWIKGGAEYFALKITGNSMEPKYLEGDVIIFLKTEDCDSGADCAVMVNGDDATFKKVIKQPTGIVLQPLNTANYEPAFYSHEDIENLPIRLIGIAKEIRRTI